MTPELAGVLVPYALTLVLFVIGHRLRVRHRAGLARLAAYDARKRRDTRAGLSSLERVGSHAA